MVKGQRKHEQWDGWFYFASTSRQKAQHNGIVGEPALTLRYNILLWTQITHRNTLNSLQGWVLFITSHYAREATRQRNVLTNQWDKWKEIYWWDQCNWYNIKKMDEVTAWIEISQLRIYPHLNVSLVWISSLKLGSVLSKFRFCNLWNLDMTWFFSKLHWLDQEVICSKIMFLSPAI